MENNKQAPKQQKFIDALLPALWEVVGRSRKNFGRDAAIRIDKIDVSVKGDGTEQVTIPIFGKKGLRGLFGVVSKTGSVELIEMTEKRKDQMLLNEIKHSDNGWSDRDFEYTRWTNVVYLCTGSKKPSCASVEVSTKGPSNAECMRFGKIPPTEEECNTKRSEYAASRASAAFRHQLCRNRPE